MSVVVGEFRWRSPTFPVAGILLETRGKEKSGHHQMIDDRRSGAQTGFRHRVERQTTLLAIPSKTLYC